MANPIKGELPIEIDGKRYVFVLGTYGLAALERRMKKPWPLILKTAVEQTGIDDVLAIFHAGLLRHHPMTEMQAADLIDAAGVVRIIEAIGEAFKLMQPEGGEGTANPPEATAVPIMTNGIGTPNSTLG